MSNYQIKITTPDKSETISLSDQFSLGSAQGSSYQVKSLLAKHFSFIIKDDALLLINFSESGTFLKNQELKAGKKYILEDKDVIKTGDVEIIVEAIQDKKSNPNLSSSEIDISLDTATDDSDDLDIEDDIDEKSDVDINIDIDEKENEEDLDENFFDLDVEEKPSLNKLEQNANKNEPSQNIKLDIGANSSASINTIPIDHTSKHQSSSINQATGSLKNVLASKKQQSAVAELDLDDDLDDLSDDTKNGSSLKNLHQTGAITKQGIDENLTSEAKPSFFQRLFSKKAKPAKPDKTEVTSSTRQKSINITKSHQTAPSGLDLSKPHELAKVLEDKRRQRSSHSEVHPTSIELTSTKKKGFLSFFKFHKKSSVSGRPHKRGIFSRLFYKLNIFKTNKIFQVGFKTRIYLLLATLSLLNVLGYQILPTSELNLEVETYVKQFSTYVKKDYLTKNLIPRIEKQIPGFQKKAQQAEKEFISNATKLGQETVAKIKENANELGIGQDNGIKTPKITENVTSKPRKKRGVYNPQLNQPKESSSFSSNTVFYNFSISSIILSNLQTTLPKIREIIRKLGPTHDKYAEIITRFILIYLCYEIIGNLLFGVGFLPFLYGIRVKGNFFLIRIKSILRTFLFFIFLPLFFLTELPVCFKKRSLKEVLSFTSYEYHHFKLRKLFTFIVLPLIIILPLLTPLFRNIEASNNIFSTDYKELPIFKVNEGKKALGLTPDSVLTPHDFKLNVVGFDKEDVSLPIYFYIAPYVSKQAKTATTGIYLYDYLVGDFALMEKGKTYDFTTFLSKASSDNPLFNKFFPHLYDYQKKDALVPWSIDHSKELTKLLQASVQLNFNVLTWEDMITRPHELLLSFFKYLINYGPLINGYVEGRDELFKLFGGSIINFKFRKIENNSFLYYSINNEPHRYCFTYLKNIKGHFSCLNTKENLNELTSYIENDLLPNTHWDTDPTKILGDEFNAFDSSYYLTSLINLAPLANKNLQLLKFYRHMAVNTYDNGDPKLVSFTKKILADNLKYLEALPAKQLKDVQEIVGEIKNIHSKLKPKLKCQEDANCFLKNISECPRVETNLKHQTRKNNIKMFYEKKLYILGPKNNSCHFIIHFSSVKTDYDEETRLKLKSAGKEDADILESVKADSKEYLAQQDKIYSCLMSTSDITELFNQWRTNIYTPDDVKNCMIISEIDDNYE